VGLFTGLITLPLAPVRGVVWVAERIAEEVDRELYDESNIRRQLLQLELDHEDGNLSDEERSAQEEDLLQRLAISQMRAEMDSEELGDG
jgi:gas vesicle protein GvpG